MTQNYERHLKNKHMEVNSKDLRVFGQLKLNDLFFSPRPQECDNNNLGKVVIDQEREEHIGMNVMGEEALLSEGDSQDSLQMCQGG